MAGGLKNLFGGGTLPPEIKGELRTVLLQMRQERSSMEGLAAQVQKAAESAGEIVSSVGQAREAVEELSEKVGTIEKVTSNLGETESRLATMEVRFREVAETADALSGGQNEVALEIREMVNAVRELKYELDAVKTGVADISAIRDTIAELDGKSDEITAVRQQLTTLQAQSDALRSERDELRAQHEAMTAQNQAVQSDLQQSVDRFETLQADLAEASQHVSSLRETIDPVADLAAGVPQVKRELQVLQALREFVAQKTSGLEEQRDLVEQVAQRGERLERLIERLDGEIDRHTDSIKTMAELRETIDAQKADHDMLCERIDSVRAAHEEFSARDDAIRQEIYALQTQLTEDLERSAKRFAFEREGLDAVNERVKDLRDTLADIEQRVQALEPATALLDDLRSDADQLGNQVAEADRGIKALSNQVERTNEIESKIDRLEEATVNLSGRLDSVREPSETAITRAETRAADLAARIEALEQRAKLASASTEAIEALGREVHRQRLTVEESLGQLREAAESKVAAHNAADRLAKHAEELAAAVENAEERLSMVRETADKLDERSEALGHIAAAMDQFEQRLRKWHAMERRLEAATARAGEREQMLQAIGADLHRMFETAEETADKVREAVEVGGKLDAGRALIADLLQQLRELRVESERVAEHREVLSSEDTLLARTEALLREVRTSSEVLEGQKAFLEQVIETASALRFQSRQAESLINSLENAWKQANE